MNDARTLRKARLYVRGKVWTTAIQIWCANSNRRAPMCVCLYNVNANMSNVCVMCKASKAIWRATLGAPFKNQRFWHDLVLSTKIIARRRVGLIFGLNQVFERSDRAENGWYIFQVKFSSRYWNSVGKLESWSNAENHENALKLVENEYNPRFVDKMMKIKISIHELCCELSFRAWRSLKMVINARKLKLVDRDARNWVKT